MENVRIVKKILPILAIFFIAIPLRAYSPNTTHHGLTSEIIKLFEYYYPDKSFSSTEREWIKNGSVDEDHDIRPMNHFYDPITNKGLWGFVSSKTWVNDTLVQANRSYDYISGTSNFAQPLFSSETDYSWDRAIYEYVYGDKKRAMESLGHVLHLVEDATVPDHTRNDPHPPYFDEVFSQASPYEGWTSQFKEGNLTVAKKIIDIGQKPVLYTSLGTYFDKLANFSNNNFFSKDTILEYSLPIIGPDKEEVFEGERLYFAHSKLGNRLVRVIKNYDIKNNQLVNNYTVDDPGYLIMSDYWNILSKEAVKNGAGVIKLFFDEVEKEKQTLALYNKNKSWISRFSSKTKDLFVRMFDKDSEVASAIKAVDRSPNKEELKEESSPEVYVNEEEVVYPWIVRVQESEEAGLEDIYTDQPILDEIEINNHIESQQPTNLITVISGVIISEGGEKLTTEQDEVVEFSILSPDLSQEVFTDSSINFSGTSTPGSLISVSTGEVTTVSEAGEWNLQIEFEQGTSTIFMIAEKDGVFSEEKEITLFIDSLGPVLDFNIKECQESLSSERCLIYKEEISLNWFSDEVGEYQINLNGDASTITATSTSYTLSSDGQHFFSVTVIDVYGNKHTETREVEFMRSPIIISEIAWAGTKASATDEWLELYNRTGGTVSLDGWYIKDIKDKLEIELSGEIKPESYYILERTNDDPISDIEADLVYTGGLSNKGTTLILYYGEDVIDRTPLVDQEHGCWSWCGGNDDDNSSMERLDYDIPGHITTNWGSGMEYYFNNGFDAGGYKINGSPGQRSSSVHVISRLSSLTRDTTLKKENSPYIIGRFGLDIHPDVTLTIEPGVVIKILGANEPMVNVDGTIRALGSESDPVIITSIFDDEYGGDLDGETCNEEDDSFCPRPGSWKRIQLNAGSHGEFRNTIIRYGGRTFNTQPNKWRSLVLVEDTEADFYNVVFENSTEYGLFLYNSTSTVSNSTFRNMNADYLSVGLVISESTAIIENPIFENNKLDISAGGENLILTCIGCEGVTTNPEDLLESLKEKDETPKEIIEEVATSTEEVI